MKQAYLLTGRPGSGKTSIVREVISSLNDRAGGFYTEEIRDEGVRCGFRLVTLDGGHATLAHVSRRGQHRVGKYGVDAEVMERLGVPALERALQSPRLAVIDEIGKMEIFSARFREVVSYAISSGNKILGTIMQESDPFADAVKSHPNVRLITVSRENRDDVLEELIRWTEPFRR